MDLFRPNALKGEWFPFGDGKALVRLIPMAEDAKMVEQAFPEGGKPSLSGNVVYRGLQAAYALVDTENIRVPLPILGEAAPADVPPNADGMVLMDGKWTEAAKRKVLPEALGPKAFASFVIDCERELVAKADAKKEQLGKA